MKITRNQRDILKRAHKKPQTETDLGAELAEAIKLVAAGLLTGTPAGFAITSDGARCIGKKAPTRSGGLAGAAAANLEELVPVALGLVQEHRIAEATGDEATDRQTAMSMLLAFCVAVGILAKILGVEASECMEAINVGRKVKLIEGPAAPVGEA